MKRIRIGSMIACEHCGADTRETVVKAALWGHRGWVAIEDIPARICETCGEQSYDEATARKIEKVIATPADRAKRQLRVPVFSLADVELPEGECCGETLDDGESDAAEAMFTGVEPAAWDGEEDQGAREPLPCKVCGSGTVEAVVRSALWPDRGLVAVEDIPARVCGECGEQFYDDETTRKLAELTERGFPPQSAVREIQVPVFSLAGEEW